ncbi:hypothetical protein LCGC14_2296770, partial [marine sediment metagenome]
AKAAEKKVKKTGQIRTIGGRVLHFPQREDGTYDWCHKALNRLIQGSAADQTKRALVDVDKAGYWIMLQVHDELDCSVENRAEGEAISEIKLGLRPIPKTLKVEMKARQKAAIKERKKGIRKAKLKALPSKAVRGLRIKGGLARAEAIAAGLPTDESQRAKIPENRQPIF